MENVLERPPSRIAFRLGLFALVISIVACTCSPFGFGFGELIPSFEEPPVTVEGISPLEEPLEPAVTEEPVATEPPAPATEPPTIEPPESPSADLLIPNGEATVSGRFFDGSGDCMANPADFSVPVLIVSVYDGLMEIEQPGAHLNTGSINQETAVFDVSTGKGENSEGYMGILTPNFSATGEYRYTTGSGTCIYTFTLVPN